MKWRVVGVTLALLVGVAWFAVRVGFGGPDTRLAEAIQYAPANAERLMFTDWAAIRSELDLPRSATSLTDLERLRDRSWDLDLSAASAIEDDAQVMQETLGISAGTLEWELLVQSQVGGALILRLADAVDFDDFTEGLVDLGYQEPAEDEPWSISVDELSVLQLPPQFQQLVPLADDHLLVAGPTPGLVSEVAAAAAGDADRLPDPDSLVDRVPFEAVAATVWPADLVCADLAMSQANQTDQEEAEALVAQAGGVSPLQSAAFALAADQGLATVMTFEDGAAARADLQARAELAVGPAIGRGGTFADILELTGSRVEGRSVVLEFEPKDTAGVLSAVNHGPVLFATC